MMSRLPRSKDARALAEAAFARLASAAGDRSRDLVLIGGLVPESLVETEQSHQGTTDVDILLDIGLVYERDEASFAWLEAALVASGMAPMTEEVGWRWICDVEGLGVVVEFLVDVPDSPGQEVALPGTGRVSAMNVPGPAAILHDAIPVVIGGSAVKRAGIGGYLASKAAAILSRGLEKDLYDFAYVIVHSMADDRDRAARAVFEVAASSRFRDIAADVWSACSQFDGENSVGARVYAAEASAAGAEESLRTLRLDAASAVAIFTAALRREVDR